MDPHKRILSAAKWVIHKMNQSTKTIKNLRNLIVDFRVEILVFFSFFEFFFTFRRFQFFSILKSKNFGFKIWALGCSTAATIRLGRLVIISHDLVGGQSSLSGFTVKPKSGQHFRIDCFRIADQKKLWYRKLKWRNQSSLRVSISSNGLVQTSLTRGKTN